jgi:PAS domain S-box-containing protein
LPTLDPAPRPSPAPESHAAEIVALLGLFARSRDRAAFLEGLLDLLVEWSGCACAGIRVVTAEGEIPYEARRGYSPEFAREECWLSVTRDCCACTRAVTGVPVAEDAPLLDAFGSYACADLQAFTRSLTPEQAARFRGRCASHGFQSLAIVPLRHRGQAVGLLHVADTAPGRLTANGLATLEAVAPSIAEAISRFDADAALARRREAERALWAIRSVALSAASAQEVLDASIARLRDERWLPELLGASIVASDRRTGARLGAGKWAAPDCPARATCGPCPDPEAAAASRFEFVGVPPDAPLPSEACAAAYRVQFPENDAVAGAIRVCHRVVRRDAQVETFLEGVAAELTGALQRRAAEAAARETERRYREFLETTAEGFVALDADGRISFVNRALAGMLGCEAEALLGRPVEELVAEKGRQGVRERLQAAGAGPERGELPLLRADGKTLWALVSAVPVLDAEGRITGRRAVVSDVTERRLLQQRLVQAERLSSMGALAAGVAHEVNNPLGYVAANVALARERLERAVAALPPAQRPLVDAVARPLSRALEGVDRVRTIVGDLKAFSRPEEEPASAVEVAPILDACAAMASNEIRHRARLVKAYAPVPPVRASPARLTQVFLNLLVNAAQAIPLGRAEQNEIRVALRAEDAGSVAVEVADTGCGIAPALRDRLFEPFFTTKAVGEGTGLGLSICHGIVTALGGRIEVESQPGAGSTFRVVLPAVAGPLAHAAPAAAPTPPPRRGRVLVVDDEPYMGEALCELLADDHDVEALQDGRAALERIRAGETWDVILCDLLMPQLTGMELHGEVARCAPGLAERIVFVSGGIGGRDLGDFLARVPNERLEKPFDLARLRRLLAERVAANAERDRG